MRHPTGVKRWPSLAGMLLALFVSAIAFVSPAFADALDDARNAGYLGERPDGYLGQVSSEIPPAAQQLMAEINRKREAVYRQTAAKVGRPVHEVQKVTGEKLINMAKQNGWYYLSGGGWTK